MSDHDNLLSQSGRLDKEALVALIDSRFTHNITGWYQTYWQPMHLENKAELASIKNIVTTIVSKMDRAEGSVATARDAAKVGWTVVDKILAFVAALALLAIGHFWK